MAAVRKARRSPQSAVALERRASRARRALEDGRPLSIFPSPVFHRLGRLQLVVAQCLRVQRRARAPIRAQEAGVEAVSGEVDLPLVDVNPLDTWEFGRQRQHVARRAGCALDVGREDLASARCHEADNPARLGQPDLAGDRRKQPARAGVAEAVDVRVVVQAPDPRQWAVQRRLEADADRYRACNTRVWALR